MDRISIIILKSLRKGYAKLFGGFELPPIEREEDLNRASDMIYDLLSSGKPCMIARYGAFELSTVVNHLGVKRGPQSYMSYIRGEAIDWWWSERLLQFMQTNAGFFPPTYDKITQFCELMLEESRQVDLLGSWLEAEAYLDDRLCGVSRVHIRSLEPFWSDRPWSRVLEGRRVVVVHPFADDVSSQYERRDMLFSKGDTLPTFASLRVVRAVQPSEVGGFNDWFEALDYLKREIDKEDYDLCLIGCGAYGFPLAAHVKRCGKQAIHLGGALQLLFGIRGRRWDNPNYGVKEWGIPKGSYLNLVNGYWVRPDVAARPENAQQIEGGCYW